MGGEHSIMIRIVKLVTSWIGFDIEDGDNDDYFDDFNFGHPGSCIV